MTLTILFFSTLFQKWFVLHALRIASLHHPNELWTFIEKASELTESVTSWLNQYEITKPYENSLFQVESYLFPNIILSDWYTSPRGFLDFQDVQKVCFLEDPQKRRLISYYDFFLPAIHFFQDRKYKNGECGEYNNSLNYNSAILTIEVAQGCTDTFSWTKNTLFLTICWRFWLTSWL